MKTHTFSAVCVLSGRNKLTEASVGWWGIWETQRSFVSGCFVLWTPSPGRSMSTAALSIYFISTVVIFPTSFCTPSSSDGVCFSRGSLLPVVPRFKELKHGEQFGLYSGSERNSGSIENTWGKYGMINYLCERQSVLLQWDQQRGWTWNINWIRHQGVQQCFLCFLCKIFTFLSKNRRLFNNFNISNLPIIVSMNQLIIESKRLS